MYDLLYHAVGQAERLWAKWEQTEPWMMESEAFRMFFLLKTMEKPCQRKGIQIIKGFPALWKRVAIRLKKEKEKEVIEVDSHYGIPAKKTWFTDKWGRKIEYDSRLEARMARLLDRDSIEFEPHVKFDGLLDRQHVAFTYTVDFIFKEPQKFVGIPDILHGIEVKGALTKHDIVRLDALLYFHRQKVWIVTDTLIDFWEREGIY